jgi:hypothetical protein
VLHRVLAVPALLALFPAHAALIEYSFEAEIWRDHSMEVAVQAFGVQFGDTITGGFLFDDAAPRTSYSELTVLDCCGSPAIVTTSTYDMSNLSLWVTLGDYVLSAAGGNLTIRDAPYDPARTDRWSLGMSGDGRELDNGYAVTSMAMWLQHVALGGPELSGPLTSSELQVPNPAVDWGSPSLGNRELTIAFGDGLHIGTQLMSITKTPTHVPEPATLSLLAGGVLAAFATRKRRHLGAHA